MFFKYDKFFVLNIQRDKNKIIKDNGGVIGIKIAFEKMNFRTIVFKFSL